MRRGAWSVAVLALALGGSLSCDSLENRLKTCRTLRVDLVNALPSEGAVHIAAESEPLSDTVTLLPATAGGSVRSIELCVEKGDRKNFRAAYGNVIVGEATCVVSRTAEELQAATAEVRWTNRGLLCEGW